MSGKNAGGRPVGDVAAFLGDTVSTVVAVYLHPTGADVGRGLEAVLQKR